MEMSLHNLNFLCTAMERINNHKEEKLGKPQTLSNKNQTVIKALITSLSCTKSFLPSFLWSDWEYLGMETDGHTSHFAASPCQIGLILQVQNHFPTKCRAVAAARACGSTHHMLVSPCIEALFLHCSPHQLPTLLWVHRDSLPIPQFHHPIASFHLLLQPFPCNKQSSLLLTQKSTFKKQLKLTEFTACALILRLWIGCNSRAELEGGSFLCLSIRCTADPDHSSYMVWIRNSVHGHQI